MSTAYNNLYNKTRHLYMYMLSIAGQTFFVDTHRWDGGVVVKG